INAAGDEMLANNNIALRLDSTDHNTIKDNVFVSDTTLYNVLYLNGCSYETIEGNYVGTNAAGTAALGLSGSAG
ncbi:MAG: hypothetical protein ACWGMZ_00570, partial [Thermoguttaceae bacterium]